MARPSRPVPAVGMPARVLWLGGAEEGVVEEVRDGGRTLVVAGEAYALNPLTGHYVLAGQPYYERRLALGARG